MVRSVATERPARPVWAVVAAWALRIVLVAGTLLALRAAPALYREAVQRGTAEFSLVESLASGPAVAAYALVVLGAFLFTVACRLPLRGGVWWPPLALALVPLILASHLPLFAVFQDSLRDVRWAQPFYFWNEEPLRWVMLALVGVALGTSIGRRRDRLAA